MAVGTWMCLKKTLKKNYLLGFNRLQKRLQFYNVSRIFLNCNNIGSSSKRIQLDIAFLSIYMLLEPTRGEVVVAQRKHFE